MQDISVPTEVSQRSVILTANRGQVTRSSRVIQSPNAVNESLNDCSLVSYHFFASCDTDESTTS